MSQMNDKYFIDTNIFLYAFSTKDVHKQIIENTLQIINPFKGE